MNITWKGSPNYWAGRTQTIREIILHWMAGTLAGTDRIFADPSSQVSAHSGYEDDDRHDYVRIEDTAWAARQANPFTINLELSAAPGRAPSDKTYENVIKDCAAYCKEYGLGSDAIKAINPHMKYVNTRCSGSNEDGKVLEKGGVDIKRIRDGVEKILKGGKVSKPTPAPDKPKLPQPKANKKTTGVLRLPASATSWNIYRPGGPWTIGNQIGRLNPSLFGGLTYDIVGNPTANVYLINTRDFGKVAIYAAPSTGAQVGASKQGIGKGAGDTRTVVLPPVPTWRVYRESGPYSIGNEIGYLAPANYNGLKYAVLSTPVPNVAVIQTQTFGRVAIYVGKETGATIRK